MFLAGFNVALILLLFSISSGREAMDYLCRSSKSTCSESTFTQPKKCSCFSCCELLNKDCELCKLQIPAIYVSEDKMLSSEDKKPHRCHCFLSEDERVITSSNKQASNDWGAGIFLTSSPVVPRSNPQILNAPPLTESENVCSRLKIPEVPEVIKTSEASYVTAKNLSCVKISTRNENRELNAISTDKETGARSKQVLQKQPNLKDTIKARVNVHQDGKKAQLMESLENVNSNTSLGAPVRSRQQNDEIDGVETPSPSFYPRQQNYQTYYSDIFARTYLQRLGNPNPKYRPIADAQLMESLETVNSNTPLGAPVRPRQQSDEIDGVETPSPSFYPHQQSHQTDNSDIFARTNLQRLGNPNPKYRPIAEAQLMESHVNINSSTSLGVPVRPQQNDEIDGAETPSSSFYPHHQNYQTDNSDIFESTYFQRLGNPNPKYRPTDNYGYKFPEHFQHLFPATLYMNYIPSPTQFGLRMVTYTPRFRYSHYGYYNPYQFYINRPALPIPVEVMTSRQKVEKWLMEQNTISNEPQPVSGASTSNEPQPVSCASASNEPQPVPCVSTSHKPQPVSCESTSYEPQPVSAAYISNEKSILSESTSNELQSISSESTSNEPQPISSASTSNKPQPISSESTSNERQTNSTASTFKRREARNHTNTKDFLTCNGKGHEEESTSTSSDSSRNGTSSSHES